MWSSSWQCSDGYVCMGRRVYCFLQHCPNKTLCARMSLQRVQMIMLRIGCHHPLRTQAECTWKTLLVASSHRAKLCLRPQRLWCPVQPMRPKLSDEQKAQLKTCFELMDADGSGAIDASELQDAFTLLSLNLSRAEIQVRRACGLALAYCALMLPCTLVPCTLVRQTLGSSCALLSQHRTASTAEPAMRHSHHSVWTTKASALRFKLHNSNLRPLCGLRRCSMTSTATAAASASTQSLWRS